MQIRPFPTRSVADLSANLFLWMADILFPIQSCRIKEPIETECAIIVPEDESGDKQYFESGRVRLRSVRYTRLLCQTPFSKALCFTVASTIKRILPIRALVLIVGTIEALSFPSSIRAPQVAVTGVNSGTYRLIGTLPHTLREARIPEEGWWKRP